jgi:low temperature requirement protein LtrA
MLNRWFHAPRLHAPERGEARKVIWQELFYDLIYVAALIQLGTALSDNVTLSGALTFAGLFVPIWYTWTGFTFYNNRFIVDDFLDRMLVFVQRSPSGCSRSSP